MLPPVRFVTTASLLLLLTATACRKDQPEDAGGPAPSASATQTPRLSSAYQTPWGKLGWQERLHNRITFTNEGQTVFLRCALSPSPVVHCRWSKQDQHDLSHWDRGKAKLEFHPDHSLTGTWGHGDSDDDGGPCNLRPLRDR